MTIDLRNGERRVHMLEIPEGPHLMEIQKALVVISQRTGKQELEIAFRVLHGPGKGVGFRRWYDIHNPRVLSLLQGLCRAAGVTIRDNSLEEGDLVGKKLVATVQHYQFKSSDRRDYRISRFEAYRPPAQDEPVSPAGASPRPAEMRINSIFPRRTTEIPF